MNRLYSTYQAKINFIYLSFFIFSISILGKIFYIQTFKSSDYINKISENGLTERKIKGYRGNIYDKNGQVLAETIKTYTFWANAKNNIDKKNIIDLFSNTFDEPKNKYEKLLSNNKEYIILAHGKYESQCEPILEKIKTIKGLFCDVQISRYYPHSNLASQVVGYIDRDHKGQLGIERQFDHLLKGETINRIYNKSPRGRITEPSLDNENNVGNGSDIHLTLDVDIQTILIEALSQGLKRSGAKSANGVIINPFTGDVLAMASIPDFDPNKYWEYDVSTFLNRTISDAYEPGSTYKAIPIATALETSKFKLDDIFNCENGKYKIVPSKTINDHDPYQDLTLSEIFIYSSNIGLSKMVDSLGAQYIYDFSRRFGFGVKSGIPLPGETSGVLRKFNEWTRLSGPYVSMGQEISVNSLQLALAYAAIANGGYLPNVRLVKKISRENHSDLTYSSKPIRRIISNETSIKLLNMLEDVVSHGTASNAKIPGYRIGGKTGTAQKSINGEYSKQNFISSFIGVFPIDNPKFVCVVSVDSPDYNRGKHWGNETAAPIVKDIFERIIINNNYYKNNNFINDEHLVDNISELINGSPKLNTKNILIKNQTLIPSFSGLTLKQSIKETKLSGLILNPAGISGKVVWQSISPGKNINNASICTVKLETM